jgi:putative chitinase
MLDLVQAVRLTCPRASARYLQGLEMAVQAFAQAGLTTPLRISHFLAQCAHECGGFTIVRENMRYSASRMMEIFGVGKHSAKVTWAEAKELAGDERRTANRVYGAGNPSKARELGNTVGKDDGYDFRGNGVFQTTGRGAHAKLGKRVGVDFENNPQLVTEPEHAFKAALAEWSDIGGNALADKNDIRQITRRINGGYNGYSDRVAWFNKFYKILKDGVDAPSWKEAEPDPEITAVQMGLNQLGYTLNVDGRLGPKTTEAIRKFQMAAKIPADGLYGAVTKAALQAALSRTTAPVEPSATPQPPVAVPDVPKEVPLGGAGLFGVFAWLMDLAKQIQGFAGTATVLQWLFVVLIVVSVAGSAYIAIRARRVPTLE